MRNYNQNEILITGMGVTSAIGQGKNEFISALLDGRNAFDVMKRSGRQCPVITNKTEGSLASRTAFLGAEIPFFDLPKNISKKTLRNASFSEKIALATIHEAWNEAKLDDIEPDRIGLIVGGSNFQQRALMQIHSAYYDNPHYLRPTYGISFMDSNLCGICTETFKIGGFAYTLGGSSASGLLAIIKSVQAIQSGEVDICLAMGALMDLSYWECQGFKSLGAMGTDRYAKEPELAARPFDQDRDGFIFGESCGVIVLEGAGVKKRTGVNPYARISGWAIKMDGNRYPSPSYEGEVNVISRALKMANLEGKQIDYVNPHGSGSIIGDKIELQALRNCGLTRAHINATKSITGHGLSAAGAVEVIATILQMKMGQLHPTRNLVKPIDMSFNWVQKKSIQHRIQKALNLSIGFGGINTALCLERL